MMFLLSSILSFLLDFLSLKMNFLRNSSLLPLHSTLLLPSALSCILLDERQSWEGGYGFEGMCTTPTCNTQQGQDYKRWRVGSGATSLVSVTSVSLLPFRPKHAILHFVPWSLAWRLWCNGGCVNSSDNGSSMDFAGGLGKWFRKVVNEDPQRFPQH